MRIFMCAACGHRMRWSGLQCGKCYEPKPVWKTPWLYNLFGFAAFIGLCGAMVLSAMR